MKEHISPRGKEQNVRALCRGPGKAHYTLCHYHTHSRLTPWPPGVICVSPFILPHALSDLCLSDTVPQ